MPREAFEQLGHGVRRWRVSVRLLRCEGVRYDLAEAPGVPYVMETQMVVGAASTISTPTTKDKAQCRAIWAGGDSDEVTCRNRFDARLRAPSSSRGGAEI